LENGRGDSWRLMPTSQWGAGGRMGGRRWRGGGGGGTACRWPLPPINTQLILNTKFHCNRACVVVRFMAINLIIESQILCIHAFCTTISAHNHGTLARRDSLKVTNKKLIFDDVDVCCHLLFQSTYVISLSKLGTIHGKIID